MAEDIVKLRRDMHRLETSRRMLLEPSTWMAEEDVDDLYAQYGLKRRAWLVAFRYRNGTVTEYNRVTGKWRAGVLTADEITIVNAGKNYESEPEARAGAASAMKALKAGASLKEVGAQ